MVWEPVAHYQLASTPFGASGFTSGKVNLTNAPTGSALYSQALTYGPLTSSRLPLPVELGHPRS